MGLVCFDEEVSRPLVAPCGAIKPSAPCFAGDARCPARVTGR